MKILYFIAIFSLVSFISCKSDTGSTKVPNETVNEVSAVAAKKTNSLPSLTTDYMKKIASSCDYIDYIFYDLPISISQDEKSAIMSNINFISRETVDVYSSNCKSMGRKSFQSDGEIILEADIYLDKANACYFYVFLENGKPAYANKISKDGINFYFNVFGQAGVQTDKIKQGM